MIMDYTNTQLISISDSEYEDFIKNGYLIIKGLFQPKFVERVKIDAEHLFRLQLFDKGYVEGSFEEKLYKFFKERQETFINCGKHIQHLISLHELSLHKKILDTIKDLGLTFPNICTRPVLYFNTPHLATKEVFYKTPSHQDAFSMDPSSDSVVVWIPLVNVNKDLGALEIVPKSHKEGLVTVKSVEGLGVVEKYSDNDFLSVELNAGDVLFFSSFLVHRSGNNITDSIRWSAHFRFNNLEDPYFIQRNYPHPYIYKPISKTD